MLSPPPRMKKAAPPFLRGLLPPTPKGTKTQTMMGTAALLGVGWGTAPPPPTGRDDPMAGGRMGNNPPHQGGMTP